MSEASATNPRAEWRPARGLREIVDQIDLGDHPDDLLLIGHDRHARVPEQALEVLDAGARRDGRVVALDDAPHGRVERVLARDQVAEQVHLGHRAQQPPAVRGLLHHRQLAYPVRLHAADHVAHPVLGRRGDDRVGLVPQEISDDAEPGVAEEAVLAHPVVVEDLREVLGRAVGQQDEDVLLLPVAFAYLMRAGHRRAARAAHEEALEAHEIARHQEALLVVDAHDLVEDLEVDGRGRSPRRCPRPCR
jgi:hypothetical protein